jgi:hypothetical protein
MTVLLRYICLVIVRKGGRITSDDAARVWLNDLNPLGQQPAILPFGSVNALRE